MNLRLALENQRRSGEVVSPIHPRLLAAGTWWTRAWPEALEAGVLEPRRGFRFRPENLALAQILEGQRAQRVVELGAGSGSLLLIAAYLLEPHALVAVERQAEVCDRLRRTLEAHKAVPAQVIEGDLRQPDLHAQVLDALGARADLVLFNPPYFPAGWGRESARATTHQSTHAVHGEVYDFLVTSRALLSPSGRALVVFDAGRLSDLLMAASRASFRLERALFIPDQRPGRAHQPFRVWVELTLSPSNLERLL